MPGTLQELKEVSDKAGYARFVHTNLHIHTPATPWDWNAYPNQTRDAASISPEEFFGYINRSSLELVAITDHNCTSWCKPLITMAKNARKEGKSRLHILPGVEITTYEGPHIIAIFDEDKNITSIQNMLIRLGLSGEGAKDEKVGCKSSTTIAITTLLDEVEKEDGLIIAPHVDSKDGLWGNKEFRGRTDILNDKRLRILAVASGEIKRVEENRKIRLLYKNMDSEKIYNSFAFINVSDCHRLDDLEVDTTWIKMSEPGLAGVRQIIYEPELRLAHEVITGKTKAQYPKTLHFKGVPSECHHNNIIGVAITGGMLDGQIIGLSPHQNSIIGRNYAGKSAFLDCIRFGLDAFPPHKDSSSHEDPYYKFVNRLRAILGNGAQVRIYLKVDDKTYCVSRVLTCTKVGGSGEKEKWKIEGAPEVSLLWNNEFHRETDLGLEKLFIPEVYPQGEVVKIKDNASQQMRIVDALANIRDTYNQLTLEEETGTKTILGELNDSAKTIIELTALRDELSQQIGDIDQLEGEITDLENLLNSDQYQELKKWADVKALITDKKQQLISVQKSWSSIKTIDNTSDAAQKAEAVNTQEIDLQSATPEQFVSIIESSCQGVFTNLNDTKKQCADMLANGLKFLDDVETRRVDREASAKNELKDKSTDHNQELGSSLLDRITEKKDSLNDRKRKKQECERTDDQISKLRQTRNGLLDLFREGWNTIRESRRKVVLLIDANSADNIHARLLEGKESSRYRKLLDVIADHVTNISSKILNKQSQLDLIADNISPDVLLDLVNRGDVDQFTHLVSGLSANTARLLIGMGLADQLALEQCTVDDGLEISYRKEGEIEFTPIDRGLSGGEQALALISVAMVPKDIPLIIDQPEDELGPALITKDLVDQIRNVKNNRQLIFVTHVPNIPVLADSEQIIYVAQEIQDNLKKTKVLHQGSLDNHHIVTRLLELDGGEDAFMKRSERYTSIVRGVEK